MRLTDQASSKTIGTLVFLALIAVTLAVIVTGGDAIVKIVAIGNHSLALDSHGQLWAWGDNTFGQLGNGTSTSSSLAIMVNNFTTANLISIP